MRRKIMRKRTKDKEYVLPKKHEMFVRHYVVTWNAAHAAKEAGLCSRSGQQRRYTLMGNSLLADPRIQEAIKEECQIQSARLNMTKERITDMLLDTHARAKMSGDLKTEMSAAMGLAKLHGLMIDKKEVTVAELSQMDEDQIRAFLGSDFDPRLIEGEVVEKRDALPAPPNS